MVISSHIPMNIILVALGSYFPHLHCKLKVKQDFYFPVDSSTNKRSNVRWYIIIIKTILCIVLSLILRFHFHNVVLFLFKTKTWTKTMITKTCTYSISRSLYICITYLSILFYLPVHGPSSGIQSLPPGSVFCFRRRGGQGFRCSSPGKIKMV